MSKISSVQEFIVEYLRENGASYINELYSSSGVSKDTFYKALNGLIEEGIVTTYRDGKRRYVKLTMVVPTYLKHVTIITIGVLVMTVFPVTFDGFVFVDFGSSYPLSFPDTTFIYFILMYVIGLWTGIIFFRAEDLESAYLSIKSRLKSLVSRG